MMQRRIEIDRIRTERATQARNEMSLDTIQEYAERMEAGDTFPAPTVFTDDDRTYYAADGFHRIAAASQLNKPAIMCEVNAGGQREAMLFAVGANAKHGLKRTAKDKRRAVELLMADAECGKLGPAEIARLAQVSTGLVWLIQKEMDGNPRPKRRYEPLTDVTAMPADEGPPEDDSVAGAVADTDGDDDPPPTPIAATAIPPVRRDARGQAIPEGMVAVFDARGLFASAVRLAGELRSAVEAIGNAAGGRWLDGLGLMRRLEDVQSLVRFAAPYVVCPKCGGEGCKPAKKSPCVGLGWVREGLWDSLSTSERAKCDGEGELQAA